MDKILKRGSLPAGVRVQLLLDRASTFEKVPSKSNKEDAAICGMGKIGEMPVGVISYDFTHKGGTVSPALSQNILKV